MGCQRSLFSQSFAIKDRLFLELCLCLLAVPGCGLLHCPVQDIWETKKKSRGLIALSIFKSQGHSLSTFQHLAMLVFLLFLRNFSYKNACLGELLYSIWVGSIDLRHNLSACLCVEQFINYMQHSQWTKWHMYSEQMRSFLALILSLISDFHWLLNGQIWAVGYNSL